MKLLFFVLFLGCISQKFCYEPKVSLKLGNITGLRESINGKDVNAFLGIPYAKKPVKELRFRKPQPLTEQWSADFHANTWPNVCLQPKLIPHFGVQSDDCLYLNIWTPVDLESNFTKNLKPVIVWFHGGMFLFGTTSFQLNNGSVPSTVGDVIVVTVNYRLGALGFMYGGSDEMPGNMGLYDQALALEWVQENIAYFGGNKNLVTIMGHSSGSASSVFHLMSPVSQNLFKYVIAMSGVATDYFLSVSAEKAIKARNRIGKRLNCQTSDENVVSESTLKCLRELDAKELITSMNHIAEVGLQNLDFAPVVGETFIPKKIEEMYSKKLFKHGTSLLIGSDPVEAFAFHFLNQSVFQSLTAEEIFRDQVINVAKLPVDVDELIKFYFHGVDEEKKMDTHLLALTDLYFNCPIIHFAKHFSSENQVYQYLLDFKPEVKPIKNVTQGCKQCNSERLVHGGSVQFTFAATSTEHDRELSLRWIKIITDFAKTGKTNWSAYYKTKYNDLVPKFYHIKNTAKESDVKDGFRIAACQLWSRMLVRLD